MKSGGKSADESMTDAKMVEIESGIHGLQVCATFLMVHA